MSDFVPPSPKSVSLRPLTKGMVSNSVNGEDGAKRIRNLVVQPSGLERRPSWTPLFGNKTAYGRISLDVGEVVQDVVPYWAADGTFMYVAITNKRLWKLASADATWMKVPYGTATYTITDRTTTVLTDSGADFVTDGVRAGAYAVYEGIAIPLLEDVADVSSYDPTFVALSDVADGLETRIIAGAGGFALAVDVDPFRGASHTSVYVRIKKTVGATGNIMLMVGFRNVDGAGSWYSIDFVEQDFAALDTWYNVVFDASGIYNWTSADIYSLQFNVWSGAAVNDRFVIEVMGLDGLVEIPIVSVAATQLTFDFVPFPLDTVMWIEHHFALAEGVDLIDFTQTPAYLVLTDNTIGGIVKFDGSSITPYSVHAASGDPDEDYLQAARTVLFFAGRMWLGCTTEVGSDGHRFARWSSLTDITEFAAIDYVDFYGEDSSVLKLSNNEDAPIVYLENAIYVGYPSSLAGLPFAFIRVERGSISLAGPHAIASAGGGQFFVSSDNFYFLSTGRQGAAQTVSCEPIGTKIVNEAVEIAPSLLRAQVFYDKLQELVYFVLPSSTKRIWRVFVFALRTKAWSYFDTPAEMLVAFASLPKVLNSASWSDLDAFDWSDEDGVPWSSFDTRISRASICAVDINGAIYTQSRSTLNDVLIQGAEAILAESGVETMFESGDLDFGEADTDKVVTRVAVEVDNLASINRAADVVFNVALSDNHGRTWIDKGNLTIEEEANEDEVHFRFRSDTFRVKLESMATPPLSINNIVLRARLGEVHNVRD